ncbi:MAG: hypothetical protein JJ992_12500, partial [Planctomycetes bacterium]|nr:hypothetical protein [Planctomycetota bacterium]
MSDSNGDSRETVPSAPVRRRLPGPWASAIVVICVCLLIGMRLLKPSLNLARADLNVASFILAVVSAVTLLLWFLRCSAYSAIARHAVGWTVLAAMVISAAVLRIADVNGDLVPTFALQWRPYADQTLERPKPAGEVIDLATTTEYDFPQFL